MIVGGANQAEWKFSEEDHKVPLSPHTATHVSSQNHLYALDSHSLKHILCDACMFVIEAA